jgi:hypothetical protein
MTAHIPRLCGEEWQNWANKILAVHYGPTEYQQVPDHDRGDAGLEGFTRGNGHAYQAYGCEEPISTADRYEKQRDKMTKDIGKFINNRSTLTRIFGTVQITRWALFVPHCNSKEMVAHASKKTDEVKSAALPYVADTFHVCVCQQSDFSVAESQLLNAAQMQLRVSAESPTPQQIAEWNEANEGPSQVLADKLLRLPTLVNDDARSQFHSKVLDWYLKGQDILDGLRAYPDTFAKVKAAKSHRESFLVTGIVSGLPPQEHLMRSVNDLREALELEVRELHRFSSESLAYEAVADWLLRCPLDFPEVANA